MQTKIRAATKGDLSDLKRLYWQLDADAIRYQPEHFVRTDRPDGFLIGVIDDPNSDFLLIEEGGSIVGFGLVQEKQTANVSCIKAERYLYIMDFVIDEPRRSRGLGKALLDACMAWGRNRNLVFLRLSVFPQNVRGIAFYAREGLCATMQTMERKMAQ